MARIAVVTPDVLSERMAGPAIRASAIAEQLARAGHDVTLISTVRCDITRPRYATRVARGRRLRAAVATAEVVIVQGYITYHAPWLIAGEQILVVDLYDPVHLEQIEQVGDRPGPEQQAMLDLTVRVLNEQLIRGDFFLCASEEQRHLWLGHLAAVGRVNAQTYRADTSLRSLIAVCPFGLPTEPPVRTRAAIRGTVPGIGPADQVILWAGGVYNWFDPLTLIRAVAAIAAEHDDVRLFFLGMKHPNPDVPEMAVAWQTRALADELGLTGRSVFFNDGWVAYDDRQNYLLDADLGVSTHFDHLETMFSFRTRILDYLWAGLPVVATGGDAFASVIDGDALGATVPERDVDALAAALTGLLYDRTAAARARANVASVRERFAWPVALAPLVAFCADPKRAADADADQFRIARRAVMPLNPTLRMGVRVVLLVRQGGLAAVAERLRRRLPGRRRRGPGGPAGSQAPQSAGID